MADNFDEFDSDEFDSIDTIDDDWSDIDSTSSKASSQRVPIRTGEEFTREVDRNIKIISSPKNFSAEERREAALWLGNAGVPKAITALVMVYKKDKKNKAVQEAAEYALGQFKALDKAIKRKPGEAVNDVLYRPENTKIAQRLEEIAYYGEVESRGAFSVTTLRRILIGLVISFVVLLIAAIVIPAPIPPTHYTEAFEAMRGTPGEIAAQQLEILLRDARRDAETIERQVNSGMLVCSTAFANPVPYALEEQAGAEDARLGTLTLQYNAIYSNLTLARVEYDRTCASESPQIGGESRTTALTNAEAALSGLNGAEALIQEIFAGLEADHLNATATAEANILATAEASITPTLTVTPSPTPGIPQIELNAEISEMFFLIGESNDAIAELRNNWQNVRDFGETRGCTRASPNIRESYELPEGYDELIPDLQVAADLVNTGLALLRDGWALFETACTNGTLTSLVDAGLLGTDTADNTFTAAEDILNQLSGR